MSFSCVGECARQNFESARGSRWQNRALRTIQKLHWSVGGQSRDCGRRFLGFPFFPFAFLSFSRFLFFSACVVPSPSIVHQLTSYNPSWKKANRSAFYTQTAQAAWSQCKTSSAYYKTGSLSFSKFAQELPQVQEYFVKLLNVLLIF